MADALDNKNTKSVTLVSTAYTSDSEYTHHIEPEIAKANIPRAARLKDIHIQAIAMGIKAWLIILGVIGFLAWRNYENGKALIARGIVTSATVYEKNFTTGKFTHYTLYIKFRTDAGIVDSSTEVGSKMYSETPEGATIPVTYLPGSHGSIWEEGDAKQFHLDNMILIHLINGIAVSAVMGSIFSYLAWIFGRDLRFLRYGVAVIGHVESGEVRGDRYRLNYRYAVGGKSYKGQMQVNEGRYLAKTAGNPYLTILHDRNCPAWNMPYRSIQTAYLIGTDSTAKPTAGKEK